jgi:hypothetical protein
MDKKIENILSLYENILSTKSLVISEADIQGVDELVYNPATKEGGTVGYGYNDGKKQKGITWPNHDNHLHIGFTNRATAIAIIDKADSMGLKTTENPYAKKDPNKKVDKEHTSGSLHYKNFPGTPVVGMAVDISGDPKKVTELIKWIEKNYAGQYSQDDTSSDKTSSTELTLPTDFDAQSEDPIMFDIVKNFSQALFGGKKVNESISFGRDVQNNYGTVLIPKDSNNKIKSPVSGIVDNSKYAPSCKNQITIKTSGKSPKYLQFCGISSPQVNNGDTISSGQLLGKTDSDVEVVLFDSSFNRENLNIGKTTIDTSNNNEEEPNSNKDDSTQRYDDPILAALVKAPFKPFQDKYDKSGKRIEKRLGYGTDKKDVDPWILNKFKKKKIDENIERIKKLL